MALHMLFIGTGSNLSLQASPTIYMTYHYSNFCRLFRGPKYSICKAFQILFTD